MKSKAIIFVLGLTGLIVLAACSSSGASVATEEVVSVEPTQTDVVARVEETPTIPATVEEAVDATATEPAEVVEVRAGLAASNPADFQVAAGEVQLVEFFAFW